MVRKTKLALVGQAAANPGAPPPNLGRAGANLWRSIMSEYEVTDSGGLAMLEQACSAADRIAECAAIIDRDGPVVCTQTGPKDHPLLKIELALRSGQVDHRPSHPRQHVAGMSTKRTPLRRHSRKFSPEAIAIFKQMMLSTISDEEYERFDGALGDELHLKPWQGPPTVVRPGTKSPYPPGTAGHEWWTADGPALCSALRDAAGAEEDFDPTQTSGGPKQKGPGG